MKAKLVLATAFAVALGLHCTKVNAQQKGESQGYETFYSDESIVNHIENGHRYTIRLEKKKIVQLIIDGKEVPPAEYSKYDSMVKKILEQVEKDRAQAEKDRAQAEKDRERAEIDRLQADKDRIQAEKDRELAERDREEAVKHREQAEKDRARSEVDRERAAKDRAQAEIDRAQAEKDRAKAEKDRQQADKDRARAEIDRQQAEKDRARAEIDRKKAEEDRKLFEAMLDEVVTEKLVENRDALKSLSLDDKELIVNDVKQPDAVHSRFKAKYLKPGQTRIRYNNGTTFRGISIN
ncbi:MAG: hypothetical protein DI535_22820 [Citrobacter freundii]|nr:MAG: hypothetical protein DI535_22820 [Citrobacter freundii]